MQRIASVYASPGWPGLVANVVTVWLLLAASIFLLSRTGSGFGAGVPGGPKAAPWTPPGGFIGAVWSVLYTLMGGALWAVNRWGGSSTHGGRLAVCLLIAFCLVWPFYSFDTASRWPGLLGNVGILVISLVAIRGLWGAAKPAAWLMTPVSAWITIATATILDGARRFGW